MFCLFKNAILPRWGQWFSWLAGWGVALWWLYFALFDQGLGSKILNGQALLIDLLLALPLVLFMAVILYAFFYWLARILVIVFFRSQVTFREPDEDDDLSEQEAEFGQDYWKKQPVSEQDKQQDERLF